MLLGGVPRTFGNDTEFDDDGPMSMMNLGADDDDNDNNNNNNNDGVGKHDAADVMALDGADVVQETT